MAAYRMTKHATTSVTPNRAMLGREVLLPAAMIAAPPEEPHTVTVPWVDQFRITIRDAHQRVRAVKQLVLRKPTLMRASDRSNSLLGIWYGSTGHVHWCVSQNANSRNCGRDHGMAYH